MKKIIFMLITVISCILTAAAQDSTVIGQLDPTDGRFQDFGEAHTSFPKYIASWKFMSDDKPTDSLKFVRYSNLGAGTMATVAEQLKKIKAGNKEAFFTKAQIVSLIKKYPKFFKIRESSSSCPFNYFPYTNKEGEKFVFIVVNCNASDSWTNLTFMVTRAEDQDKWPCYEGNWFLPQ